MVRVTEYTAGVMGVVVTVALASSVPPEAALVLGATVAVLAIVVGENSRRFALGGTTWLVLLTPALAFYPNLPQVYRQNPMVCAAIFAALSGAIVGTRALGRRAAQHTAGRIFDGEYTDRVYNALSGASGVITIIWTVLSGKEKIARTGGIAGAGSVSFALGILGVDLPIPFWLLEDGLSATMFVLVGSITAGFHTLSTLYNAWFATKQTAAKSAGAATTVARKQRDVAAGAAERAKNATDTDTDDE